MINRWTRVVALSCALALYGAGAASAQDVVSSHAARTSQVYGVYGQSVLTPVGSALNNIRFNFDTAGNSPYAIGKLYLLTSVYANTPGALSTSTAGFLDVATASNNLWTFNSTTTLQANMLYYFYMDNNSQSPILVSMLDNYADGSRYYAANAGSSYSSLAVDMNFDLQGLAVAATAAPVAGGGVIAWILAAMAGASAGGVKLWRRSLRSLGPRSPSWRPA